MECPDTLGVANSRRRLLRTADERIFLGKNTLCTKRPGEQYPTWLANEIVFAEFARTATLRTPDLRLLENRDFTFLGSEVLSDRKCLDSAAVIADLFTETNRSQLIRALLLDLALLNNDRTHKNVLRDRDGSLWFVDHDKSLWGDGLSP